METTQRGLVTVRANSDGLWSCIEDLEGTMWAELDYPIETQMEEIPDDLRASVVEAYEWAKEDNQERRREETEHNNHETVDWNQWWWEQTRGRLNMNLGRY